MWFLKKRYLTLVMCGLVVITLFMSLAQCSSGSQPLPNIIIIVMDTVRIDHLSCCGYSRETTPNLNKLVKQSRLYLNAYSTSSWTPPAHASLFTGLYPIAHRTTQENHRLPRRLVTLAEVLLDKGYETFAISGNPLISKQFQFDQGFLHFFEAWRSPGYLPENSSYIAFKEILNQRDRQKPFFLFINFIEPHTPYDSARFFAHRFVRNSAVNCYFNEWVDVVTGKKTFTTEEIEHLIDRYDAEILYVDYLVGKIISQLKSNKLWHNTLFIVTSDHGENFMEHNLVDHMFSLHQTLINIPLIIKYPRLFPANSKDYTPVQLTDIFPTLLYVVGVDQGTFYSQGCNLLNQQDLQRRTLLAEYYSPKQVFTVIKNLEPPNPEFKEKQDNKRTHAFRHLEKKYPVLKKYYRRIKTVIDNNFKLIWGSDGEHELYDLKKDPRELNNLINERHYTRIKLKLLNKLKELVKKYEGNSPVRRSKKRKKIDKETEKALKSLGYL
ncbi:MAG: sulfatase [Candidatus Aminicenantes bacterium]|nr:MAG: sulfatase [Candidatus Aminicenantes bacterium]